MSKIYILGDTHIGLGYPNKMDKWLNIHKEYFSEFLIPFLKNNVKEGDRIVHLGDLLDNRDIIPINILNYTMNIVEEISNIAPMHILIGNHDCWSRSSTETNSIRPLRYIPNVFIYDKETIVEFDGKKILMMPFIEDKNEQISIISENKNCEYLFCHSDLNGCKMHLTSAANKNLNKIDIEEFVYFKKVFSGHIHIRQSNKNFEFVGSNFQMDRNDYNDQKGITILDLESGESTFVANKTSPIFKKVAIFKEEDIDELNELIDSKDFIDIEIYNDLLVGVNSRKLRRKLEILLEKKNFESITYVDNITNNLVDSSLEDENDKNLENDIVLEHSITLDFKEYIKSYIDNQKYEVDNFKDGLMSEYDNIIDIYTNNYKK